MRISLFAPAAALLGLFAINAQAADMATMANSPDSHNTQGQMHTTQQRQPQHQQQQHQQPQHRQASHQARAPQHNTQHRNTQQARNTHTEHDEPGQH